MVEHNAIAGVCEIAPAGVLKRQGQHPWYRTRTRMRPALHTGYRPGGTGPVIRSYARTAPRAERESAPPRANLPVQPAAGSQWPGAGGKTLGTRPVNSTPTRSATWTMRRYGHEKQLKTCS